ncbi:MAG: HlyC/CorC family transporter, partial [Rhodothermales bacterium]|nr:HlyC/CorC family transporter [Rhodothermales bacterium]
LYLCDGRLDLDDLNDLVGSVLDTDDLSFETLGGLVFHLSGTIPNDGDVFTVENIELTVHTVDNRRVERVLVKVLRKPRGGESE